MKKIAGKIALILVLILAAGSFSSCFSLAALENSKGGLLILTIPLDIITLPFQAIGYWAGISIFTILASGKTESQIYLANADNDSLKQILNSIPESERNSTIEKFYSIPETKRISLINAYNSVPESEIIFSIKRINSMSEKEIVSLLLKFNSLSETGLDSLIDEL
jgi:hypothetical protein